MAFIGMLNPTVAKVNTYAPGSAPTYQAGMIIGRAITGNLTINRNNNPLYADDGIAEDDNSIASMSLELGVDDLSEEVLEYMGLLEQDGETEGQYLETGESSPEMGVGYIRVRRLRGVTSYQAIWIFRGVFGPTSENAQTKAESITWQTPTVTGNCMLTDVGSNKHGYRRKFNASTYEAALAWLKAQANITETQANTTETQANTTENP